MGGRHGFLPQRRISLVVALSVIGLVVLIAAAGVWIGFRALEAKGSLENAQSLIADLQTKVNARDFAAAAVDAKKIKADTSNAVSLTSDPIKRL